MSDRSPSAALTPVSPRVRRGRRGRILAVVVLPLVALVGVLSVAWTTGLGDRCGGPLPGCGNVRNAGDIPITIRAVTADVATEREVAAGERATLAGTINEVRVNPGECLIVEGGPFWDARTVIDRTADTAGVWIRIDDWGARVLLDAGTCRGKE